MGSDPQSHLNEQNFLLVGERKITEADWTKAVRRLASIKKAARKTLELPVAGEVKESFVNIEHFAGDAYADLTRGVAARYIPELPEEEYSRFEPRWGEREALPTDLAAAPIALLYTTLVERMNQLGKTLAHATAEAVSRQQVHRAMIEDVALIESRLKELEILE